jgi:hypothetical protein
MVRKLLFTALAFLFIHGLFAQTVLKGTVTDKETGEAIPYVNVIVQTENGNQVGGASTDFEGVYTIKPLPPGSFTVIASCIGFGKFQMNGVLIKSDKVNFLNIKLSSTTIQMEEFVVQDYVKPLIDQDNTQTGTTVTAKELEKMTGRGANAVATSMAQVYSENGEVGSIAGARASGNVTFLDGQKVFGSANIPKFAIQEVSVYTGGLDAKYGDVTGGVTNITTKGVSDVMFGGVEYLTSQYLDNYGYHLFGLTVSGPLFTVQDKVYPDKRNAVLGYFVSGELSSVVDGSPAAIGLYEAKEDVRQSIIDNPLRAVNIGFGTNLNAEFLHSDAFKKVYVKRNADGKSLNISGKIDFSPSKNVGIVIGGSAYSSHGRNWSFSNSLFNWDRNSESYYTNLRTYVRLTQQFGKGSESDSKQAISNVFYYIQADYEKTYGLTWDSQHKDNLFNYGYIGKFTTYKIPSYTQTMTQDTITGLYAHLQDNFYDTLITYQYSNVNPYLANYTQRYYNLFDDNYYYSQTYLIQQGGGLLNGDAPNSIYGLWNVPGAVTTCYSRYDNYQFRISAFGSADIKNHALSLGFEFENRSYRSYGVAPYGLWTLARGLMNKHIAQLDKLNPIPVYLTDSEGNYIYNDDGSLVFMDTISYDRLYSAQDQALFDIKFRQHLGKPIDGTEWIDIDFYDPAEFNISYFSPDELYSSGNSYVGYMGYDAYGNLLTKKPSLQDFFTESDLIAGKRWMKRQIAPYEPNYAAAYVQDKFSFNDLVFNIGLRVDRFDANQSVLKDPYTLYDTYKAGDDDGGKLLGGERPSNIGDDFVVYVDNVDNPTRINGYRNGNTWYDASGTEISDPQTISSATGISPYLINPDIDMNSDDYDVSMSFKDYEPQITVMPRISFSFPISDVANFYAHYDVLSTRPEGNVLDPSDYLFFNVRSKNLVSNPDLKPQKTVDYAVGFQQKLSPTSALHLEAYYRDMRDMIQSTYVIGVYKVNKYMTYGNIDFGTVKGFTISYDLRRTGNVTLRGAYTLQFANGTGSGPNEGINLIASGQPNLRTLIPLSYDQRHAFVGNIDFRFLDGTAYNGPKIKGKNILKNTGANLTVRSGSGSPYSKRSVDSGVLEGSLNGSRKPWRTTLDLTLDRDISLKWGGNGKAVKKLDMNIYLEVTNLLNTKNIISVYSTTGNPDDDGYLAAAKNQTLINTQIDPESYRNYYTMAINSPYNYSLPRRIRLGIRLGF